MQYIISTILLAGLAVAAPEAPLGGNNGAAPRPGAENAAGGPYPPSGWKPSGRLLVLPAKQVAQVYGLPKEYGPPTSTEADFGTTEYPNTTPQEDESVSPAAYSTGFAFEQLQQQPGADHGVYHVLLPDGKLQRVEYVTAPLKSSEGSANKAATQQQSGSYQQQEQAKYQNQYAQQSQYQQYQNGKYQQAQYPQQFQYQQAQTGKYQQGQFEQTSYPQPAQAYFPSSFPQPVFQQPQSSKFQQASQYNSQQTNSYRTPSQYQQAQNGKYQQGESEPVNYFIGYQQPQNNKYAQNQNQAQTQYPQQPEYESNASQNQFNQKKYNKQQGSNNNSNQNKQVSTSSTASSQSSSRFTNVNNAQQQQPVVEYQPLYYVQQQQPQQQPQQQQQPDQDAVEAPAFTGFVANVQYKDVEPIPAPVYTYNPAPLVRILRKTE